MSVRVDVMLMGHPKRQRHIDFTLQRLGLDPKVAHLDDRPGGGAPLYTSRKGWLAPLPPEVTHRLLIQDDVIFCDDFLTIVDRAANAFPSAFFSFFHSRITAADRQTSSPYVLVRGGRISGQAILMPVVHIVPCLRFIDLSLPGLRSSDIGVGEYADQNGIMVMTTIPSTIQHIVKNSLIGHNNYGQSRVWIGYDLSGENWNDTNYSVSRNLWRNQIEMCIGPHHPYWRKRKPSPSRRSA